MPGGQLIDSSTTFNILWEVFILLHPILPVKNLRKCTNSPIITLIYTLIYNLFRRYIGYVFEIHNTFFLYFR